MMLDLKEAEQFAVDMVRKAGNILKNKQVYSVQEKDFNDFVTNLDLEVEELVMNEIRRKYQDHNIHSEETESKLGSSDYLWVLDPVDGTKYIVKNVPLYTVSLALMHKDRLVVGAVYHPSTDMLFHASKANGAYCNDNRIHVSSNRDIKRSMVYLDVVNIHDDKDQAKNLEIVKKLLLGTYRTRCFGVGSLGLCYLAQGMFDGYFDLTGMTKFVDVAAGICIVREAGGEVMDMKGNPINKDTTKFFASNRLITKDLKKLIETPSE